MISSVTVAEVGGEIDTLCRDVLLVLFLPVEGDYVFDGSEVGVFVWTSGSIFDIVEREVVLASRCDCRAGFGATALIASVTVAAGVFWATERLDELLVEAVDNCLKER